MKTQELRIGNYLYYEHTTHIVSGVHGNKVYSWWVKDGEPVIEYEAKDISGTQVENPYLDVISQFEPIPLTDEWLEKFGFKKSDNVDITIEYRLNDFFSIWKKYGYNVFYISQYNENNTELINTTQIKEVHQLQNLYFTLTGEELILK